MTLGRMFDVKITQALAKRDARRYIASTTHA